MMGLYSVAGSIPTLNSANISLVGFGGFHFFEKLSLRGKADGEKGAKIPEILQQPKQYLTYLASA